MSDFTFLDNTIISDLSKDAVKFNPTALEKIYNPNTNIVVTSTIYREATVGYANSEFALARKSWLDAGIASGKIFFVDTPEFPAGIENMGELSMIHAASTDEYAGKPVTFVSNDGFFNDFDAYNLQPNQRHYTGQQQIFENLVEGGLSVAEYFVTAGNLAFHSNEAPIFEPGETVIASNRTIIDASDPLTIVVTASDGTRHVLNPFERFSIDNQGNVEKLGTYIPETGEFVPPDGHCFLAGTAISMWKAPDKPIEDIRVGDWVTSYDKDGNLVPGRVKRLFRKTVRHILDVHGMKVTPGHVTLCGEGQFKGRHVPIIDILRSDGALVHKDGSLIRANTGCLVDSIDDRFVWVVTGTIDGNGYVKVVEKGKLRLGTRFFTEKGEDRSIMECILSAGNLVSHDGLIINPSKGFKTGIPFFWRNSQTLPKPEDYILQRSKVTLEDIYGEAAWGDMAPVLAAP